MTIFIINLIFILFMVFLLASLINNLINLIFDVKEDNVKAKRLKQMKRVKEKEELKFKDIMDAIADPTNRSIMPRLKRLLPSIGKLDLVALERDLKLTTWDDAFTPESFIGAVWGLRCIALPLIILSLFLSGPPKILLLVLSVICIMGLEFWLRSSIKAVKEELFAEFPDFIRIVSGYLSADIPLVQSITDSIKYVGEAWEPILKTFVIDCENKSIDFGLEKMKNTVDLFEVKEFVSLIRLTLEQGGNAKEGFLSQADKIAELQKNQLVLKVGKRKMMGQAIQGPLLFINMAILALPTLAQAMSMFSGTGGGFAIG